MWPWGHLAFGYFVYSLYHRVVYREPPTDWVTVVAAFGTQFPDLVDKPLAWWFGVLPNGRSLTHSVITASVVIALVYLVTQRRNRQPIAVAFAIGYVSHLATDALGPILGGTPDKLAFLLWPILPAIEYNDGGLKSHFTHVDLTPIFWVQAIAIVSVFALWYLDKTPGTFGLLSPGSDR